MDILPTNEKTVFIKVSTISHHREFHHQEQQCDPSGCGSHVKSIQLSRLVSLVQSEGMLNLPRNSHLGRLSGLQMSGHVRGKCY